MKYKLLRSAGRNFTHSFVSYMNYFDNGYVIDDLRQLARQANGERIVINWLTSGAQPSVLTKRVLESIETYKTYLRSHFER